MKRASYLDGVEWIALNDDPGEDPTTEQMTGYISVLLLADLFKKVPIEVARDVLHFRILRTHRVLPI